MHQFTASGVLSLSSCALLLSACGGGSASLDVGSPLQQRVQAATLTAQTSSACMPIRPFYWEIGDRSSTLASGSIISSGSVVYSASSVLSVASASKWLYAAYVAEKRAGLLTNDDIKYLNFKSGYTDLTRCEPGQTVDECLNFGSNGNYVQVDDGKFFYNGGHMQKHATLMGLGSMDRSQLGAEMTAQLGGDSTLAFSQPQLAGGVVTSPAAYSRLLRKMLTGELRIGSLLGADRVCTNPSTCSEAVSTPLPLRSNWSYSLGHWVEDAPPVGDGAFSSAGLFGFYPWIDATRTYYGIVAREAVAGASDSIDCGQQIRKAWLAGEPQP